MLAMSLTGSSNGVEMDGLCNARARFSFVLHGAWNSLEMQWMMSCRIYELPLRWTGLHEVRCLVISTMRCAGIFVFYVNMDVDTDNSSVEHRTN